MPSNGRPLSNTCCGAVGAPCTVVDSGPPDRMMPFGANVAISSGSWAGPDFALDAQLAAATRAQLRVLRAAAADEAFVGMKPGFGHGVSGLGISSEESGGGKE